MTDAVIDTATLGTAVVDPPTDRPPTLEVTGIVKSYGPNTVLKGVSLGLRAGEIVGLLGANGAGKSTLIKAIVGAIGVDEGSMQVAGDAVDLEHYSTHTAGELGIHCVYQDPSICTNLTVFENFYLIQRRRERRWRANSRQAAREALDQVFPDPGFSIQDELSQLSLAEAHMVEIAAAATHTDLRVLILDEPSSALSFRRTNELHDYLRRLADQDVAIVYVSHKIEDVQALAERLVILRDGFPVWEGRSKDIAVDEIIIALGGQKMIEAAEQDGPDGAEPTNVCRAGEPMLSITGLSTRLLKNVELTVWPGEIVGLAGLEGSGQRDVLREVFRPRRATRRNIAKKVSTAYVTGDRESEGAFVLWDIADNITIASVRRLSRFGVIDRKASASMAERWLQRLKIDAPSTAAPIVSLSGGNQQKALIARGLGSDSRLLLLDDPTRGVDIGTKQEIYGELASLRAEGRSALLYSTENTEFRLCDRVYMLRSGEVVGELDSSSNTPENIVGLSFQQKDRDAPHEHEEPAPETTRTRAIRLGSLLRSRTALPLLLLIAVLAVSGILNTSSLSPSGLSALISSALPLLFAAAAEMLIIMAGDIDLGVGTAVGLTNVISATLLVNHPVMGVFMLFGFIAAYAAMGWLIEAWQMPSIIVTLGASFVWLGVALTIQPQPGGSSPGWLSSALTINLPYVPESVIIAVIVAILGACYLRFARRGVVWRALGNKPRAVYQAGLSTTRSRVSLYATAGLLIVIAGLITTGLNLGSDANASTTYTLSAIAAVIVGGAEFAGGFVTTVGVVAAAIAFALIPTVLVFLNVGSAYASVTTGAILVGTLALRRFGTMGKRA